MMSGVYLERSNLIMQECQRLHRALITADAHVTEKSEMFGGMVLEECSLDVPRKQSWTNEFETYKRFSLSFEQTPFSLYRCKVVGKRRTYSTLGQCDWT